MKRIITVLFLFLLLPALMFAGGSKEETRQSDRPTTTDNSGSEKETEGMQSWEKDNTPIELEWYVGYSWYNDGSPTKETSGLRKMVFEDTGIEYTHVMPASNEQEVLNTAMMAGKLFDIITIPASAKHNNLLIDGGDVYGLLGLMDQYAPLFKERIPEEIIDWYKHDDGELYGYPVMWTAQEEIDEYLAAGNTFAKSPYGNNKGMMARSDIMKQLGIDAKDFTEKDTMIAALKKVKEASIDNNGQVVKPIYLTDGIVSDPQLFIEENAWAFGLTYENSDGHYISVYRQPEYLEMIKFINRLQREGLLDLENLVIEKNALYEKIANGGIFLVMGAIGGAEKPVRQLGLDSKMKKTFEYVGPVHSENGAEPAYKSNKYGTHRRTYITKDTKYPDRALSLLDYSSTEEMSYFNRYGIEGVHHTVDENGRVVYTQEYLDGLAADRAGYLVKTGIKQQFMVTNNYRWKYGPVSTEPVDKIWDVISLGLGEYTYPSDALQTTLNSFNDLSIQEAENKVYVNEKITEMIVADSEAEVDELYQEMLNKLDKSGKLKEIEAAYDVEMQEHKKKMDMDFVHPRYK